MDTEAKTEANSLRQQNVYLNDPRLSHIIAALPIFHILSTSLFLWAYCIGFGANVQEFITPSDFFTSSIRDMVPIYLLSLTIPFATSWMNTYIAVDIRKTVDKARGHVIVEKDGFSMSTKIVIGIICLFGTVLAGYLLYRRGVGVSVMYFTAALLVIFVIVGSVTEYKLSWTKTQKNIYYTTIIFFIFSFTTGFGKGYIDRTVQVDDLVGEYTYCGQYLILRRIGANYIGASGDNTRVILSDRCTVSAKVP